MPDSSPSSFDILLTQCPPVPFTAEWLGWLAHIGLAIAAYQMLKQRWAACVILASHIHHTAPWLSYDAAYDMVLEAAGIDRKDLSIFMFEERSNQERHSS